MKYFKDKRKENEISHNTVTNRKTQATDRVNINLIIYLC